MINPYDYKYAKVEKITDLAVITGISYTIGKSYEIQPLENTEFDHNANDSTAFRIIPDKPKAEGESPTLICWAQDDPDVVWSFHN